MTICVCYYILLPPSCVHEMCCLSHRGDGWGTASMWSKYRLPVRLYIVLLVEL